MLSRERGQPSAALLRFSLFSSVSVKFLHPSAIFLFVFILSCSIQAGGGDLLPINWRANPQAKPITIWPLSDAEGGHVNSPEVSDPRDFCEGAVIQVLTRQR